MHEFFSRALVPLLALGLGACGEDASGVAGSSGLGGGGPVGGAGGGPVGAAGGGAATGGMASGGTAGASGSGGGGAGSPSGGAAGAGAGGVSGSGGSGGSSAPETCVVEAENYTSQNGYSSVNPTGASGGVAMQVGASGLLNFDFDFKTGGRYFVWLRTLAADSENNGLFIQLDGKRIVAPSGHPQAGVSDIYLKKSSSWQWEPEFQGSSGHSGPVSFDAPPGKHTVSIEKRKIERPLIDKIVINKSTVPPTGQGPPEQICQ